MDELARLIGYLSLTSLTEDCGGSVFLSAEASLEIYPGFELLNVIYYGFKSADRLSVLPIGCFRGENFLEIKLAFLSESSIVSSIPFAVQ